MSKLYIESENLSDFLNARTSLRKNTIKTGFFRSHRSTIAEVSPVIDTTDEVINEAHFVSLVADQGAGDDMLVDPFHCAGVADFNFGNELE